MEQKVKVVQLVMQSTFIKIFVTHFPGKTRAIDFSSFTILHNS